MTLNNSNLFMTLAALFMLITSVFFVHFIYKVIGGVKFGRDFFLFFDFMLFSSGWQANGAAITMILSFAFLSFSDFFRSGGAGNLAEELAWMIPVILLFIHCRYCSGITFQSGQKTLIFREFFLNLALKPRYIILWVVRLAYILWVYLHLFK